MAGNLLIEYNNGDAGGSKERKHSGFSSTITTSFAVDSSQGGLVWDGTDLIYTLWKSPYSTAYFKKGTGFSGTVQSSFTISGASIGDLFDIDMIGTDIIMVRGGAGSRKIWRTNGFSSTISASVSTASPFYPRGVCWDGTNLIYSGNNSSDTGAVKKCSGFTSTIIDSFTFGVAGADASGYGITWDGTNLIMNWITKSKFTLMTGFSSTIANSFTDYSTVGMDWDGFPGPSTLIKTINGLVKASVGTVNGLAIGSVKTFNGLA
jgi:hypothetical protein